MTKARTATRHFVLVALTFTQLLPGHVHAQPVGEFNGHTDVGSPRLPGAASFEAGKDEYLVSGAGTNMWFGRDQFHFVWKRVKGDFIALARAELVSASREPHRKLGWLARTSLEPDAAYADTAVHGDGLASLQFRRRAGAITEETRLPLSAPDVIQLERKGSTFIFSGAHFGEPFQSCQVSNLDLGDEVYLGLFVCSHQGEAVEQAAFRDVRLTFPPKPGFVPYRDFLGSRLEILDTQTGRRQLLLATNNPLEAPNWTPDGRALIYNVSGRSPDSGALRRFEVASRQSSRIDTGSASHANNDHVLSFDGKLLGFSHRSADPGGQSVISIVPVEGGSPSLVTPVGPSYLHGWSPDGKFLVYTAKRAGSFNVFRIPSDGGGEVQLTHTPALDDGPEYSPDGRFIYFCSARKGRMQLWRMGPDGEHPEQLTNDEFNNWFPHVSPDGKQLAFISFLKDVPAESHPYYKPVYLRLMPATGGEPRVVAYLYGGQGTMNVPSWAPDSRRLAFVSN